MHLSVVVPCFNEQDNIASVVHQAAVVGRSVASKLEIVVVDDGSTDGTAEVLRSLQRLVPELRTATHSENRGYGAAVRTGFGRATLDYVFLTDGDGQFDLGELPRAVELLKSHDVVAGYRKTRCDGWWRALCGQVWTALVNVSFGLRIRDANCAFKLMPRSLLRSSDLRSDGALISAELLYEARRAALRVAECPVSHYPRRRGRQTGASLRVIARAFKELAASIGRRRRRRILAATRATSAD